MVKTWVKDGCVRVSERAGVAGGNHVMPMALREGSPAALCCMETARPTKGRKGKKKRKEAKKRSKEKKQVSDGVAPVEATCVSPRGGHRCGKHGGPTRIVQQSVSEFVVL